MYIMHKIKEKLTNALLYRTARLFDPSLMDYCARSIL